MYVYGTRGPGPGARGLATNGTLCVSASVPAVTDGIAPPGRQRPRLFDAFPGLADRVPWMPLAHAPTPVERCTAIGDWLGRDDVWMKRDDLASPLYGGNKVRRYEFVLADAVAHGARRLVTAGGIASTQVMATALFGRALGLAVKAVLFDQPLTHFARRALLVDATAGAELVYGGSYLGTALAVARARLDGGYLILPGAAGPLANLGYLDAMIELDDQVRAGQMPRPDVIVVPAGSSGTLAALALGVAWLGWPTEVVGVRITTPLACNRVTVEALAAATARFVRRRSPGGRPLTTGRFRIVGDALGPGYGHPTPEALDALPRVTSLIGVPGEVTYSGKALVALRRLAADERQRGRTLLLWNTLSAVEPPVAPDARERLPPALARLLDQPVVA